MRRVQKFLSGLFRTARSQDAATFVDGGDFSVDILHTQRPAVGPRVTGPGVTAVEDGHDMAVVLTGRFHQLRQLRQRYAGIVVLGIVGDQVPGAPQDLTVAGEVEEQHLPVFPPVRQFGERLKNSLAGGL